MSAPSYFDDSPAAFSMWTEGVVYESSITWLRDGHPPMPEPFRFSWHRHNGEVVWMTKSWRHDPMPFEMTDILFEILMSNPWKEAEKKVKP